MRDSQQHDRPEPCGTPSQRAYDLARADDLRFLQAWEQGLFPVVGAAVRIASVKLV